MSPYSIFFGIIILVNILSIFTSLKIIHGIIIYGIIFLANSLITLAIIFLNFSKNSLVKFFVRQIYLVCLAFNIISAICVFVILIKIINSGSGLGFIIIFLNPGLIAPFINTVFFRLFSKHIQD
jgi:hypothetical protein